MIDPEAVQEKLTILRNELSLGSAAKRFKEADSVMAAFVASLGYQDVAIQFLLTREWQSTHDERDHARKRIEETRQQFREVE